MQSGDFSKSIKICFPTSSGGHLTQLYLLRPYWEKKDRFWVTFDKEDALSKLEGERVYTCHYPTNRNIPNLIKNTILAVKILRVEHPDVIISTGAAVAIPFFLLGRLFHSRRVFIEVFDRLDKPTITGRICHRHSDLFIVQWESMLDVYPGSVYLGSVF